MREYKDAVDFQTVTNEYAHGAIANIKEMLDAFHAAEENEDDDAADDARTEIENDALSVEVRSDWVSVGGDFEPTEYKILLTIGGPAAQIVGELNQYKEPVTAVFQYQDWFKPWTNAHTTDEENTVLLEYARFFYFGE